MVDYDTVSEWINELERAKDTIFDAPIAAEIFVPVALENLIEKMQETIDDDSY